MANYGNNKGSQTRFQTKVWLHIYDLSPANDYLWHAGFGIHHSGIEVSGVEYSFASGAGIYESNTPAVVPGAKYRERVELGSFDGGSERLKKVIDELKDTFGPDDYNIIRRNCNHFSNALSWKLLQRKFPSYVNRASDMAVCLSCLIPKKLLEHSPVGDPNDQNKNMRSFHAQSVNHKPKKASVAAFTGAGRSLVDASERKGLLSRSSTGNNGGGTLTGMITEDLTDRREKMRKAALARLEQNQVLGQGDKQS
jgi:hypothetical protein